MFSNFQFRTHSVFFNCDSLVLHWESQFFMRWVPEFTITICNKASFSSLETQGQIVGARESLNGWKNKARRKEKLVFFWHQSEARMAVTVWNWSGKTLSPGPLLAILYFSFVPYFSTHLDFPSSPLFCPWVSKDASFFPQRQSCLGWKITCSSFQFHN